MCPKTFFLTAPIDFQSVIDPGRAFHSTGGQQYTNRQYNAIVVGVTKMGNIVPRVGIKPKSLAFQTSVLPSHP